MKKLLIALLLPICFACTETEDEEIPFPAMIQAEEPTAFSCINAQADNSPTLENAKKLLIGKWQLKGVIAMIRNPEIPNYQIEFKEDGGVFITLAGKSVFTDAYSLIEATENDFRYLKLVTDNLLGANNEHNIAKGTVRVCEKELMLDQGIAFDAPGYLFRKVK